MIRRGEGVVIGVSGGPDSVALLHVLDMLKSDMGFWIAVAHVDHGLRAESAQDAVFVEETAEKLGLKAWVKRVDVRSVASREGVSVEEAGRRVRYAFFEEVRDALTAHLIATAHHLDDELETFFLRVFRGASLKGLSGIPATRGKIIRPLIRETRSEIFRFLQEQGIPYRPDPTNLENATERNFIRNRLFPVIAERFPDFRKPLHRSIGMIRQEARYLEQLSEELYSRIVTPGPGLIILDLAHLRDAPPVLASRVVRAALYNLSGGEVRWTRAHLEAIMKAACGAHPSARLDLTGGVTAKREYDRMTLARDSDAEPVLPLSITIEGPGTIEVPGAGMKFAFRILTKGLPTRVYPDGARTALFDAEQASFPLILRSARPGDRFRPWGMEGTRKLKRVFIDLKVPVRLRRTIPILVKGEEILWLPGIRRGRAAEVGPRTRRVLEVSLLPAE